MPVSAKLAYEIFYIELWHILSLFLFLGFNYYLWKKARKTALLYSYLATQLMLVIWMLAKIGKTVSPDLHLRWAFIVLQYFGVSFLGGTLFLFAYRYSKQQEPPRKLILGCMIPCLLCFSFVVTNPIHSLFYRTFDFYGDTFGPLFYLHMSITYSFLVASAFLLSRGFFAMFGEEKIRAYLFLLGISVPILVNLFYITDLFWIFFHYQPLFDYTPIAANISLLLFALAAFRYRFLDMMPVAGNQIFEELTTPIAVFTKGESLLAANDAFTTLFPDALLGACLREPSLRFLKNADYYDENTKRSYRILAVQKRSYQMIRLVDKTQIDSLLQKLRDKNEEINASNRRLARMNDNKKRLAEMKAERHVLQELHDILGHATVLSISACEAEIRTGALQYRKTLQTIETVLQNGREEFSTSWKPKTSDDGQTSLVLALQKLASAVNDPAFQTELIIQGDAYEVSSQIADVIYSASKEALTNTLKHGQATMFSIILRYSELHIDLYLIDDGKGCAKIVYGKGLSGIKRRFFEINGKIAIRSDQDCGFYIHAEVNRHD